LTSVCTLIRGKHHGLLLPGPGLNGIDVFSDNFLIREETKTPEAGGPKKAKLSRKETEAKTWRELAEKLMVRDK